MTKPLTLGSFGTLQNSSIISTLNANNTLIEDAFSEVLSQTTESGNAMASNLDMDSNQIINLPAPSTSNSPIRLADLAGLGGIPGPPGPQGPPGMPGSGSSGTFDYDTRTVAIAAHVPTAANYVRTLGYTTVGDGGGATYAKVNSLTYPTYGFTDAGGTHWQYVPEPEGWNAKVAGVVANGVTDDSMNLMNALLPFQNSTIIFGGGNRSGKLLLPAASIAIKSAVVLCGSNSQGFTLQGQSASAAVGAGTSVTAIVWTGTSTYPSSFIVYGCNQTQVLGVNFVDLGGTSKLVNNIHYTSDVQFSTTLTAPVTAGSGKTFTVGSTTGLSTGAVVGVGLGAQSGGVSTFEVVYVTSVPTGQTFVADCVNAHSIGEQVGGGPPSNGVTFNLCHFSVPEPFINNRSCGILCGNNILPTVQAAQLIVDSCVFAGLQVDHTVTMTLTAGNGTAVIVHDLAASSITDGTAVQLLVSGGGSLLTGLYTLITYYTFNIDATSYHLSLDKTNTPVTASGSTVGTQFVQFNPYAGIRMFTGGNVKNYRIINDVFVDFQYGIGGEAISGSVEIDYPTFATNFIADVLAVGASNLYLANGESESSGQAYLLGPGGGNNAINATLIQNSYQCGLPFDKYVVKWGGNLTLINNNFFSQAGVGNPSFQAVPQIQVSNISQLVPPAVLTPGAIMSSGNYYAFAGANTPIFFDASNVPLNYGDFQVLRKWRVFSVNDYGDNGWLPQLIGSLSVVSSSLSLENTLAADVANVNGMGLVSEVTQSITLPFGRWQAAATSKLITLFTTPPRTKITGVVADVTTPFTGTSDTISLEVGDNAVAANNFLLSFDAKSGVVTKGIINGDLGAALNSATIPTPDGYCEGWAGGDLITATMVSGGGQLLSGLSAGSVTIYVTCKRF